MQPAREVGNAASVDPMGEVWDGDGARWRCRIEKRTRRGRSQYRWVLERKWVSWRHWRSGMWTRREERARKRARRVLLSHSAERYEEVGRV